MEDEKSITRFDPSHTEGLSSRQAEERIKDGAVNKITDNTSVTVKEIIVKNVFTYFNLIFAVFAVVLLLARQYSGLTFMPIIIANTLIGIIQQIRSKRVLDKLNMLNAPKAQLVRDGKIISLPADCAVLDDIAVFSAGNQVYADAVIKDGTVLVNESLLTGETDEITKHAGDTLMSGSFIISGECRARLDMVGDRSYIARLSSQAKKADTREHSQMMSDLNKLIKIVGIIIIPIGIIMFLQQFFGGDLNASEIAARTIAALLGMIPEGLYLLASVALALSVMKLAKKRVLVHDMSCVETLARVNVLCVDKTGTITGNDMAVCGLHPINGIAENELYDIVSSFAASMTDENITMKAIKQHFTAKVHTSPSKVIPFSSAHKFSAVIFGDTAYILGAPEFVLRDDYRKYKSVAEEYIQSGLRTLVFAKCKSAQITDTISGKVEVLGFILLHNPIRKEARHTFKYFEMQGVAIKVISGDNPITASNVAVKAGIKNADKYIDLSDIDYNDTEALKEIAAKYTVFGRVSPQMKRSLIHALQDMGNTVAMTGDGVNDVLALKDADCSVAMASGSEAAENVSQIVLLDSDFSCMPDILYEGRRVVNNIERSAGLFLRKNIFSLLLSIFSMISFFSYPLLPQQVSLINAFTIGIPAFLLALEPNKNLIKGRFLTNVIIKALPAALTNFIVISSLVSYGSYMGYDGDTVSTAATFVLGVTGILVLLGISLPMNTFKAVIIVAMAAGFLICSYVLRSWFSLLTMNFTILKLIILFSAAAVGLLILLSAVQAAVIRSINRRKSKRNKKQ